MRNALRNLALIPRHPSIAELSFGSSPVLVLGAGPSADSLLDGLERRFGGALHNQAARPFKIICVDTCLPALRDRNIPPDLAVILESQHWNLRDFIGSRGRQIPAAMDLSALPATGEILSGGLFLFMTPWTPLRIFDRLKAAISMPAEMPPLGSVGLCATELGRRLTRGMIIVAGLDFSFTPDSYHARSTPGHQDKLRRLNRLQSPLNAEAAFASAAFAAESKSGLPVRSNPAMRNYRALFEQEFAGDGRLCDIPGSGLPLGIRTIPPDKAFDLLAAGASGDGTEQCPAALQAGLSGKLRMFLLEEKNRLTMLRDILSGSAAAGGSAGSPTGSAHLETLVDEYDCLWAHFPDYAAAGGRRPDAAQIAAASPAALSFLKRLRAEIDPALALLEMTLQELPV
jgi:hypothetical protein